MDSYSILLWINDPHLSTDPLIRASSLHESTGSPWRRSWILSGGLAWKHEGSKNAWKAYKIGYVYIYLYIYVCIYICMYIYIYMRMIISVCVRANVCTVWISVCVCKSSNMHAYAVHAYVHVMNLRKSVIFQTALVIRPEGHLGSPCWRLEPRLMSNGKISVSPGLSLKEKDEKDSPPERKTGESLSPFLLGKQVTSRFAYVLMVKLSWFCLIIHNDTHKVATCFNHPQPQKVLTNPIFTGSALSFLTDPRCLSSKAPARYCSLQPLQRMPSTVAWWHWRAWKFSINWIFIGRAEDYRYYFMIL